MYSLPPIYIVRAGSTQRFGYRLLRATLIMSLTPTNEDRFGLVTEVGKGLVWRNQKRSLLLWQWYRC